MSGEDREKGLYPPLNFSENNEVNVLCHSCKSLDKNFCFCINMPMLSNDLYMSRGKKKFSSFYINAKVNKCASAKIDSSGAAQHASVGHPRTMGNGWQKPSEPICKNTILSNDEGFEMLSNEEIGDYLHNLGNNNNELNNCSEFFNVNYNTVPIIKSSCKNDQVKVGKFHNENNEPNANKNNNKRPSLFCFANTTVPKQIETKQTCTDVVRVEGGAVGGGDNGIVTGENNIINNNDDVSGNVNSNTRDFINSRLKVLKLEC